MFCFFDGNVLSEKEGLPSDTYRIGAWELVSPLPGGGVALGKRAGSHSGFDGSQWSDYDVCIYPEAATPIVGFECDL